MANNVSYPYSVHTEYSCGLCVFADDMYWIYDSHQPSSVNGSRPMTEWGNIVGDLDDVMFVRSGYIYFFCNGRYYRFNCKTKMVRLMVSHNYV